MSSIKKPQRGESPDLFGSQNGHPSPPDGADVQTDADIEAESVGQASGQAGSNGRDNGRAATEANVTSPAANCIDLESQRLSQDFESAVTVKKLITTVKVMKPLNHWFIRTRADPAYWLPTAVLELGGEREIYLVARSLWGALATDPTFSPRLLVTSINRQGVLFLWPIKLPGTKGRDDPWSRSARDAADEARTQWIRVTSNTDLGAYEVAVAVGQFVEPEWPSLTLQEIVNIAFRNKMITTWDHTVLRQLRGEI
jgi:hypothetical protein